MVSNSWDIADIQFVCKPNYSWIVLELSLIVWGSENSMAGIILYSWNSRIISPLLTYVWYYRNIYRTLPCYNHNSHFDFIVIFMLYFRLQAAMHTIILAPIFFILVLSFLPPSQQQQQNGVGFGIIRPTQQERQFIRGNRDLKLVLNNRCGNSRWFTVTRNQCPIAFIDPTFLNHQQVCNK